MLADKLIKHFTVIILIVFSMEVLQPLEAAYKRRHRNITITVRFKSVENLEDVKRAIEAQQGAVVPFGDALIYSGLGYLMLFERASAKQDYCKSKYRVKDRPYFQKSNYNTAELV